MYCHAEGFRTKAGDSTDANNAIAAHAEGASTEAKANYSHATGVCTQTQNECQVAIGKANVGKTNTLFEIGNGQITTTTKDGTITGHSAKTRSNIFEVYDDGSLGLKGTTGILKFTPEMIDKLYAMLNQ
jgi:hypothetical protein